MAGLWRRLRRDSDGAVAPTVALSLVALIAVGGIAFDYARFATMDSELQNAADQAALAAASQLDGTAGACARAAQAARELVTNRSLLANDGEAVTVIVATEDACDADGTVRFYQDRTKETAADSDANARFVEVEVDPREAVYALTPIIGLLRDQGKAIAFAGLNEAICKVPPLMICNPTEPDGNTNQYLDFDVEAHRGIGYRAIANTAYEPGSFGFLETGQGNGANELLASLAWNTPPGDCSETDGVAVKEGLAASVLDGISVRFDVPGAGLDCPAGGNCAPSVNTIKDLVRPADNCNWDINDSNSTNFAQRNYRPTSAANYPAGTNPQIMGHPRDLCHAWSNAGSCTASPDGRMGTGDWDINAYWRANHGGVNYDTSLNAAIVAASDQAIPAGKTYPTRYMVYRWEAANHATQLSSVAGNGGKLAHQKPVAGMCKALPSSPYGIVPDTGEFDRRKISAAVVNCKAVKNVNGWSNLNGKSGIAVGTWMDLFLVEPPVERKKCKSGSGCNVKYTEKFDVYVEFVGQTEIAGAAEEIQLVKKSVPFLIE